MKQEDKPGSFWSRKLTAEEWGRLHELPDFKLLLDWLARDHPKKHAEPQTQDTQPTPPTTSAA